MTWSQLTMIVDAKQTGTLSNLFEAFFAQAVTSKNAGQGESYEVAFPGQPNWQKVAVTGLFNGCVELDPIIEFIHSQLSDNDSTEIPTSITKLVDQDWERVWLSSFKPIKVGSNLWICPSWCEATEPQARNIILDPGLAFGTGSHATTGLCLNWLATQKLNGKTVLDYGSGSGILAIAALFSGAAQADAADIDPLAVAASRENAQRNGVAGKMHCCLPSELRAKKYDLVIANILAEVIIELRHNLLLHLASGGRLLLTGILHNQVDRVITAFLETAAELNAASGAEPKGKQLKVATLTRGQWCLLVCS